MKAGISIQTVFMVMMAVFMIIIITFGIQRLMLVDEALSEQQRLEVTEKMTEMIEYCDDPLAQGSQRKFSFNQGSFDSVCYVGSDHSSISSYPDLREDLITIKEGGQNVVLLKTDFVNGNNLEFYQVVARSTAETEQSRTQCFFDKNNTGTLEVDMTCG